MDRRESDSTRRELSNGGLESVVTLLVHRQIIFLCASTGGPIQLYIKFGNQFQILRKRDSANVQENRC